MQIGTLNGTLAGAGLRPGNSASGSEGKRAPSGSLTWSVPVPRVCESEPRGRPDFSSSSLARAWTCRPRCLLLAQRKSESASGEGGVTQEVVEAAQPRSWGLPWAPKPDGRYCSEMSREEYLLADQPSELERLQLQSRVWEPSGAATPHEGRRRIPSTRA